MEQATFTEIAIGGLLKITIREAKLLHDDRLFTKMDPFIAFEYEGRKFRTKVAHDGGRNPHWGEHFEIKVGNMHHELKFMIMDDKLLRTKALGFGMIKLGRLCHNYGALEWLAIFHDGKLAGELLIETKYVVEVVKQQVTVNTMQQQQMSYPPNSYPQQQNVEVIQVNQQQNYQPQPIVTNTVYVEPIYRPPTVIVEPIMRPPVVIVEPIMRPPVVIVEPMMRPPVIIAPVPIMRPPTVIIEPRPNVIVGGGMGHTTVVDVNHGYGGYNHNTTVVGGGHTNVYSSHGGGTIGTSHTNTVGSIGPNGVHGMTTHTNNMVNTHNGNSMHSVQHQTANHGTFGHATINHGGHTTNVNYHTGGRRHH